MTRSTTPSRSPQATQEWREGPQIQVRPRTVLWLVWIQCAPETVLQVREVPLLQQEVPNRTLKDEPRTRFQILLHRSGQPGPADMSPNQNKAGGCVTSQGHEEAGQQQRTKSLTKRLSAQFA